MRDRGFTITELMIAIVIIGIVAAIAAPNFARLSASLRMNAAARDISSTLQLARIKAIAQNTRVRIGFDKGANTYQLEVRDPATEDSWNAIKNGDCSHPVPPLYTLCALPQGVTFEDVPDNITFQSGRGNAAGGTIKLQNTQGKKTEIVVALTGRVRVEKKN